MSRNRHFPIGSDEGLAEARKLIADAARSGARFLDLSNLGLTKVPEDLWDFERYDFSNLEFLDLKGNRIEGIPIEIGSLPKFIKLDISSNQLANFPDTIPRFALEHLQLDSNQLTVLPETIGQLTALKSLQLDGNQLTALPEAIGQLSSLTSLKVGCNRLATLPETIGRLASLELLSLSGNQLTTLPETIGQLTSLCWLRLDSNQLTALPETIGRLSCLDELNLDGNQLTTLPETIGQLPELKSLSLASNQLATLPKSIAQLSMLREFDAQGNPFPPDFQPVLDNGRIRPLAAVIDWASESKLPQPFLRPFPEPEAVFAAPVERYARHLHPLVSIELSAVDPVLSGWIHLVSPIEPCDGYLGDSGREYWGPYLQPNWIGFRLTPEHRYELLGDFRFFAVENIGGKQSYRGAIEDLEEFYEEMHASFVERKAAYLESGQVRRISTYGSPQHAAALSHLGGLAPVGNLVWSDVPDVAFTYTDADRAPRTADGRLYKFIAAVPGWNYRRGGADCILLYYDPVERIALQTFVFT